MPSNEIVKGYKATDKNMQCRGFQFVLGEWHKHDGEIAMCESGFHFCEYPSGPWAFYSGDGVRMFKVESRGVIKGDGPGADLKHVAMEIRLVEEISVTGDLNTGNLNTGDRNTGDRNTGDRNTGYWNTGDRNTGDWNTGDWNTGDLNTGNLNTGNLNTGDRNTGNRNTGNFNTGNLNTGNGNTGNGNTGDRNTGDWNTGNLNTGNLNTGDRNTGDRNTGDRNTGNGNATDKCSGHLCLKKQPIVIFDEVVNGDDDAVDWGNIRRLSRLLAEDKDIDPAPFLSIPNATVEKIRHLHEAHKERRRKDA